VLDLDHPQSRYVFAAAHQLGLIQQFIKKMTYSSRRAELLASIEPAFVALRWLNDKHFGASAKTKASIEHLWQRLNEFAGEAVVAEGRNRCTSCGGELTVSEYPGLPTDRYCSPCYSRVAPALEAVESLEAGFGTVAI
jgi:hypothetical protein